MLRPTIILPILTFALTSLTSKQDELASDFQMSVDRFVKKYSADHTISKENLDGAGQQYALDTRTKPTWSKKMTLKSKTSFINKYNQKVYQRLYLSFYRYDKDQQCTAALDSLLNCFGGLCGNIKWGVKGQSAKTIPCIYIINEREIVACHVNCEQVNDFWATFKQDLTATFGNTTSRIIDTGCGGSINFNKARNDK